MGGGEDAVEAEDAVDSSAEEPPMLRTAPDRTRRVPPGSTWTKALAAGASGAGGSAGSGGEEGAGDGGGRWSLPSQPTQGLS